MGLFGVDENTLTTSLHNVEQRLRQQQDQAFQNLKAQQEQTIGDMKEAILKAVADEQRAGGEMKSIVQATITSGMSRLKSVDIDEVLDRIGKVEKQLARLEILLAPLSRVTATGEDKPIHQVIEAYIERANLALTMVGREHASWLTDHNVSLQEAQESMKAQQDALTRTLALFQNAANHTGLVQVSGTENGQHAPAPASPASESEC